MPQFFWDVLLVTAVGVSQSKPFMLYSGSSTCYRHPENSRRTVSVGQVNDIDSMSKFQHSNGELRPPSERLDLSGFLTLIFRFPNFGTQSCKVFRY